MSRRAHLLLLPWALWATLETASVPAQGAPLVRSAMLEQHATYQDCTRAAEWAESQPDLREEWTVTNGRKYVTTVTYACRQGGPDGARK